MRRDPYERADTDSNMYNEWWIDRVPRIFEAIQVAQGFLASLKQFPPSQAPVRYQMEEIFGNILKDLQR
jgi:hypothetical protein